MALRIKKLLADNMYLIITMGLIVMATISSVIQLLNFKTDTINRHNHHHHKNTSGHTKLVMADSIEHLFWFLQISDLHLSVNFDPKRGPDFEIFCTEIVDAVKPSVVLATGDITDARTKGAMGSQQFIDEWIMYSDIINRTGVLSKTLWLDLRGNHDDFGVYSFKSDNNFFSKYSVQGKHHNRHYSYTVRKDGDTYVFIGIDACLEPGPKRPFNVMGLLHEKDMRALEVLKKNATDINRNMTIWFGHYPTPAIIAPKSHGLQEMLDGPYLSGHVHMNNLYAVQPQGFLDIELADWRAKRKFRIAAVDHEIFSFADLTLGDWPIILITNPKPSNFEMAPFEPLDRILRSTHIRVLVFSKSNISSVKVKIDSDDWSEMRQVNDSPLYVSEWNPSKYIKGLHLMSVMANDDRIVAHQFSFDGSKAEFPAFTRFMMAHFYQTVWGIGFFMCVFCSTVPLMMIRLLDMYGKGRYLRIRAKNGCCCKLLLKAYLLSCVNKIFVPIIGIPLYATFGPWLVGRVIEGHFGTCFVWGLFIEGSYLPGGVVYVLGMAFIIFIHVPTAINISHSIHMRYLDLVSAISKTTETTEDGIQETNTDDQLSSSQATQGASSSSAQKSWYSNICHNIMTCSVFCLHFAFSLVYFDAYGIFAWIFGFLNTWSLFLYIYLWRVSKNLKVSDFPESCLPRGSSYGQSNRDKSRISVTNRAFGKDHVVDDNEQNEENITDDLGADERIGDDLIERSKRQSS